MRAVDEKINIVKILNFPIENNKVELQTMFQIEEDKNSYRIILRETPFCQDETLENLKNSNQIKLGEVYKSDSLWVVDDKGQNYTLFDFSYKYIHIISLKSFCIDICYNAVLCEIHAKDFKHMMIDKIETEIQHDESFCFDFNYDKIHISAQAIDEDTGVEWEPGVHVKSYTGKIKICLEGKLDFEKAENLIWRLSEFRLLCYENMFFYNTFTLYSNGNTNKLVYFMRSDNSQLRRKSLCTKSKNGKLFCNHAWHDIGNAFGKFVEFRNNSGILFDVFRTTVYSNTFLEDYPLRFSQTLEGLANFLELVDTGKRDTFFVAIQISLLCNEYIKDDLPKFADIKSFCEKIKNHRHNFSHVKAKCEYIKGEENNKYAEILYTTLRVLIIKHIKGML